MMSEIDLHERMRVRRSMLSVAAVLALFVTACSGGGGGSNVATVEVGGSGATLEDETVRVEVGAIRDLGTEYNTGAGTLRQAADQDQSHRYVGVELVIDNLSADDLDIREGSIVVNIGGEQVEPVMSCIEGLDCMMLSGGTHFRLFPNAELEGMMIWPIPNDVDTFEIELVGAELWADR